MDPYERERMDRLNREAGRDRAPDGPSQPADAGDPRPLIVMICAALAATVIVLGIMWVNNTRYDGTSGQPVAEQRLR